MSHLRVEGREPTQRQRGREADGARADAGEGSGVAQLRALGRQLAEAPSVTQLRRVAQMRAPVQRVEQEHTEGGGLPAQLARGIEALSGESMADVSVTRNSSAPEQLQAHAYTQGSNIQLAAGQERHLAHEAWHVVQQKQGRVRPTTQLQGVGINDDADLESEADRMGAQALELGASMDALDEDA